MAMMRTATPLNGRPTQIPRPFSLWERVSLRISRPSIAATGIASVGSAALDNEECWIYQALMRALGLVYIEHQARI